MRYNEDNIPMKAGEIVERENIPPLNMRGYEGEYLPYKPSYSDVKSRQIVSQFEPTKPWSRDVRCEILDKLELETVEEFKKVGLYSALGSSFDKWHGVDCFIEYKTEKGIIMVTIDVTTRHKKDFKSDILAIFPKDNLDPDLDETKYLGIIEEVAEAVANKINNRNAGQVVIDYGREGDYE